MRIWHETLIPKLCRQHLLAMWREGLGCYKIITENKKGYRNHPATKEFERAPMTLWHRLELVRKEMIKRGYNPKELPEPLYYSIKDAGYEIVFEWQSLNEQIETIKNKHCHCNI